MVRFVKGNIFDSTAECLVNPVNCVGVMGKGLALEFKKRYPEIMEPYIKACREEILRPGRVQILRLEKVYIANLPTKNHWHGSSSWIDIRAGLNDLVEKIDQLGITSVAVPKLGCGLGGLDYAEIKPLMKRVLDLSKARVTVYE